jgi:hypothetical protein
MSQFQVTNDDDLPRVREKALFFFSEVSRIYILSSLHCSLQLQSSTSSSIGPLENVSSSIDVENGIVGKSGCRKCFGRVTTNDIPSICHDCCGIFCNRCMTNHLQQQFNARRIDIRY